MRQSTVLIPMVRLVRRGAWMFATFGSAVAPVALAIEVWPNTFGPGLEGRLVALSISGLALRFVLQVAWRFWRSIPEADVAAIRNFLAHRGQSVLDAKRMILGGPPDGHFVFRQVGRPYIVLALDPDGSRYVHRLALKGRVEQGDFTLLQKPHGFWKPEL